MFPLELVENPKTELECKIIYNLYRSISSTIYFRNMKQIEYNYWKAGVENCTNPRLISEYSKQYEQKKRYYQTKIDFYENHLIELQQQLERLK